MLGWLVAAGCCLSVLYANFDTIRGKRVDSFDVQALYNALSRSAWAVGVSWVVFACATGYGGRWNSRLLFISYKFVKGFLVITFLLLVFSSWNFHDVCQRFLYNQEQNSSLIRQKTKIFPIDPHYKNRPLCNVMSIDMTLQKWAIFIMGVYGEISHFFSDSTEILFLVV